MRHYEIMLLIHPDRSNQVPSMVQKYTQLVQSSKGIVHRLEDLKRRLLAYPINKLNKAYYILLNIECDPKTQQEIQGSVTFNDSIVRALSIRQEKAIIEPSVLNSEKLKKATQNGDAALDPKSEGVEDKKVTSNYTKKNKYRTPVALRDEDIDYKNVEFLANYITDTKKMARRRVTGANAKQQHQLREAIKRARLVGLLPYCDKYEQPEIN